MNIYLELTARFNTGRLRAVICSGQATVLHRLAVMSKDGDWILREDEETTAHVLAVLSEHGARYRFGAPLDVRWLAGGWSSHFEFRRDRLRVRTDFFTRPPRIPAAELPELWREQEGRDPPFVNLRHLADMKKTNRERDYAIIGELARLMTDARDRLLYSRSARDLKALAQSHPDLARQLAPQRPVLTRVAEDRETLEAALDAERRSLMHANERRLALYAAAYEEWSREWRALAAEIAALPLLEAHEIVVERAEGVLPFRLSGAESDG